MSTLLYGFNRAAVPADEKEVRSTVTAVDNNAPSAVSEHRPDYNEVVTDPDTEGGITPHQVGSYVNPSEQYSPTPRTGADDEIVNRQISTSGTAAAREAAGEWGHGTLMVTEGIEPVIRDGGEFTELYFKADERSPQQGMGNYMTPASTADSGVMEAAQATGNDNARQAASPYAAYLRETTGYNG